MICPLSGVPCLPFYGPRGSRDYKWEKGEQPEAKKVLRRCRVFLSLRASPADMADGARDSFMLGVCPLMMPRSGLISKWSRPIPPRRAARRTKVLIHDPTGSGWRSDCTSVTVENVSLLLDRSGCRILPSGSTPEGKWRRPQHCKTNDDAHNTVRALTCLEGLKVPVLSHPDSTFLQACRVWSSVLRLT